MAFKHKDIKSIFLCFLLLCPAHAYGQGHFLAGVSAGYDYLDADLNLDIQYPTGLKTSNFYPQNESGFFTGILGGYQYNYCGYFAALEASLDWADITEDRSFHFVDGLQNHYSVTSRVKQDFILALYSRLGYEIAPWMDAYLKVGVQTSRDSIKFQATRVTAPEISVDLNERENTVRFLAGFGFQWNFAKCLSTRLEYYYASRHKISAAGFASDQNTYFNPHMRPIHHTLKASLLLNFK